MIDVKPFVETLGGKPVAVLGLGISNVAAVKALTKAGAQVVAWDDNEDNRAKVDCEVRDFTQEDMNGFACLVLAPGIPTDKPEPHRAVVAARDAGLEIICDLEILHRCNHGRQTIGVTGTNGKSTTTALIGHITKENGISTSIGGNIGRAALDMKMPAKNGVIVLEISSFQLELCPTFAPDIGVHLNLSPDHLDRHGSMENYAAAKQSIFRGPGDAVIGVDDEWSKKIYSAVEKDGQRTCYPVSVGSEKKGGVYVIDGTLYDAMKNAAEKVSDLTIASLPGVHNHQNAAASYAAAHLMDIPRTDVLTAMQTFPGLQHRQYLVRTINGVAYVNDSKATNAAATARALASYKNVYWIAGGRPKEGGLEGLQPYIGNVKHALLIGEAMDEFGSWLDNHGVPHEFCHTLERATQEAHRMAQSARGEPGGTGKVLLSPACASFDQFSGFEERGNIFTEIVAKLPEEPS